MTAPKEIIGLVELFSRNREKYRSAPYNEEQARGEFIDPFFQALGWDMANRKGKDEEHKDVIRNLTHKDRTGGSKAPDYTLRIGGVPKFFLEAKKPAVDIKNAPEPAYQLRRYAWSAKLPLSLLTNFDCLALYDTRIRPRQSDKPSAARVRSWDLREYAEKWDEIRGLFNPDEIEKGSLRPLIESAAGRRGTSEVDAEFLSDIEKWREDLAHNIARNNRRLSVEDLNTAVQRTIDRIIFLRMCEDRGIEPYAQLQRLLDNGYIYSDLLKLYEHADKRYNSGLFYFDREKGRGEPDTLTTSLKIENDVLKKIIGGLYYPDCPYEFSVLPAEILGNVYEQFLGKVIRLTATHQARVEEKPEVKKAGGVYYTPKYIVDYIVKNTVGKLCEGKSPGQIEKLRILDPACGSGSFLLGAYTRLLDYHRDWYAKRWPKQFKKEMYRDKLGQLHLATAGKKRILLNNIYGVDIDPQAVEVTKLSLLLKILEGENAATLEQQRLPLDERALPDLDNNIKCGNSLIGTDFYNNGGQGELFDIKTKRDINAFDWKAEFSAIFKGKNAGFDAVIGNPPYVRVRIFKEDHPHEAAYFERVYKCATHVWDIYLLFFERAVQLLKDGGHTSFIVPIQTLHQPNCLSLREMLLKNTSIEIVADLSLLKVFQNAVVKNCILVCRKPYVPNNRLKVYVPRSIAELENPPLREWPQKSVLGNSNMSLKTDLLSPTKSICDKMLKSGLRLGDICYVTFGLRSCAKGIGEGSKGRLIRASRKSQNDKPYLEGRDIDRYAIQPTGRYIQYLPEEMYSPRSPALFEARKIVSQSMLSRKRLVATLDNQKFYCEQSLVCILPHGIADSGRGMANYPLEFVLGILNSRAASFYFGTVIIDYSLGGGLIHATPGSQENIPVPKANAKQVESVVRLVDRMLALQKQLPKAKGEQEHKVIQRQIDATDHQIDELVYDLYGLTHKEIAIVEGK
jgi:type I restriction-modification system DNA methylase subunit/predicted type IV restriction endonuclease